MTEKELNLLSIDLSSRLFYPDTKIKWKDGIYNMISIGYGRVSLIEPFMSATSGTPLIEEVRPILRSLDSMTVKEYEEFNELFPLPIGAGFNAVEKRLHVYNYVIANFGYAKDIYIASLDDMFSWFNSHFFDYRGLIGMSLAIKANKEYDK